MRPNLEKGIFLGFEYSNLRMIYAVTAANATRWTADEPLRLKYKVRTSIFLCNEEVGIACSVDRETIHVKS
ncbi:hypothetical protein Plhal703r1_c56g0162321 [Plasmopara halstedii]